MKKIIITAMVIMAAVLISIAIWLPSKQPSVISYEADVIENTVDNNAVTAEIRYDESYAKNIDDENTKLGLVYNDDALAYKVLSSIVSQYCARESIEYSDIYVESTPIKEDGLWYYPVVVHNVGLKVFYYTGPNGINGYLVEE